MLHTCSLMVTTCCFDRTAYRTYHYTGILACQSPCNTHAQTFMTTT